ncbi:uncharacterized protein LOC114518027 [Dendronephthya gigantea]|uniref:uncharacterized protein LOC114518027 n=1 Tax=Dendronephthya gigantea TaxID=151771 RepID=UPI00106DA189|nr:uncharacterized protein LOC114518027 [Dendronephthya gigantea]
MRSFLLQAVFSLVLLSFHRHGNATRYLPSIVWDHYNPMLACKCNWFNIARFEIYDRFDFVCPTLQLSVGLLDSQSRPKAHMNYHILMRKWKGGTDYEGLNELKRNMTSGEFCNPSHKETQKLYTCKNGDDNQGYTVRFARDNDFYKGDLVVFFSNEADGLQSDLTSSKKHCAMAFLVNVTWGAPVNYDFSYGKNLDGERKECSFINTTCFPCETTPTKITTLITTVVVSSTAEPITACATARVAANATRNIIAGTKTAKISPQTTVKTTPSMTTAKAAANATRIIIAGTKTANTSPQTTPTPTTIPTLPKSTSITTTTTLPKSTSITTTTPTLLKSRTEPFSEEWDRFKYGFLAGIAATLFIIALIAVISRCRPGRVKSGQLTNQIGEDNNGFDGTLKQLSATTSA